VNYLDEVEKMLISLRSDYVQTKHEHGILMSALQFIENNPPETPAEYAVMRDVARKAINECD
jgi:hypothetical protein